MACIVRSRPPPRSLDYARDDLREGTLASPTTTLSRRERVGSGARNPAWSESALTRPARRSRGEGSPRLRRRMLPAYERSRFRSVPVVVFWDGGGACVDVVSVAGGGGATGSGTAGGITGVTGCGAVSFRNRPPVSVVGGVPGVSVRLIGTPVSVVSVCSGIGPVVSSPMGFPNWSRAGAGGASGLCSGQSSDGCIPSLKASFTTDRGGQSGVATPPLVSSTCSQVMAGGAVQSAFGCPDVTTVMY